MTTMNSKQPADSRNHYETPDGEHPKYFKKIQTQRPLKIKKKTYSQNKLPPPPFYIPSCLSGNYTDPSLGSLALKPRSAACTPATDARTSSRKYAKSY
jgi:hypothetical protein